MPTGPVFSLSAGAYNLSRNHDTSTQMDAMSDYIKVCEEAARAGGELLLERLGSVEAREKGPSDLVTEADLASQDIVRQIILRTFPDHSVIGEEQLPGLEDQRSESASEYRWIIDPLDGTTNYVHQVPHFCVSVALEHSGELLVGAVFDPVAKECFLAVAGEGASLNRKPIHTSNVSTLSQALAAIGFPAQVSADSPDLKAFLEAAPKCQAIRRTGSAALNLCYVAAGRFDAFWCFSTRIWDIAAGALLIRESGGVITAPDGGALVLDEGRFLAAANHQLHAELRGITSNASL